MNVTSVILAKNEEKNIRRTIESVKDISDEILVIDDDSDDETVKIAEKYGARVLKRKLNGDFSAQRNFADSKAHENWILHLDADEELSPELKDEIKGLEEEGYLAYFLRRRDFFWGRELKFGETRKAWTTGYIRLYKKGSGIWKGAVHETYVSNCERRQAAGYIDHRAHQTVASFLEKVNMYSTLRAKELQTQGKKASLFSLVFLPIAKFKYTYFLKLGFCDGPPGFVYAFMMSFHSFLVRAKLYQYTILS